MGYSVQQVKDALRIFTSPLWNMALENEKELKTIIENHGIFSILNSNGEFNSNPLKNTIKLLFESFPKWGRSLGLTTLYKNERSMSNTIQKNLLKNEMELFQTEWKMFGEYAGIVITDMGLHQYSYKDGLFASRDEEDTEGSCYYRFTNHVTYYDEKFHFYGKNGEELGSVHLYQESYGCIKGDQLAKVLTQICQLPENTSIEDLLSDGDFEGAKQSALAELWCNPDSAYPHFDMGEVLFREFAAKNEQNSISDDDFSSLNEAKKEYEKAIELFDEKDEDDRYFKSESLIKLSIIEFQLDRFEQSRYYLIQGLDGYEENDREELFGKLSDLEEELKEKWDNFIKEVAYKERKFIMPIKDANLAGCVSKDIFVFRQSNIPSCIKFPTGHPVANQLYIGHPFNSSLYVPYEESEELFFLDKVHEFRYLLECLGAEEISITSIKGKDVSEFRDSNNRYAVDGEIKRFSAGVEVNTQYKNQNDSSSHSHRSMIVKLDPLQKPFLPDGLIWYNEMPQWQRLVQSRLHGNLLEYSEFVSTAETKFTSSSEMTDIKASAKFLWAKAHAEVDECFEKQFKESTETQWKVEVKFRSMKGFENQMSDTIKNEKVEPVNQIGFSKEELEYAEEVKFCLEDDGIIDDSERRLLERKRIKFGISQKRAAEIEKSLLQSQLTEDEQEYLEAVKEELVGGKIPEASRRLLERLRKRMDVSDERAKEIEIMAMKR